MSHFNASSSKRPSLREEIASLDKDLLHLLLRRYNILQHMRGSRGHLIPAEEKQLREAWQAEAVRVSNDPRLSSQFFSLLQEIAFFPKPKETEAAQSTQRQAFNLAPARKPVQLSLPLPLSHWHVHATLIMAAFQGSDVTLTHCLMHDGQHALVRILSDMGARVSSHDDSVRLEAQQSPVHIEDVSLHVGCDLDNFYLLLAQHIIRPSRVRFTAEGPVKMTDLTEISRFLPTLGARLTYAVPRQHSFPVRVECSGMLPDRITVPKSLPARFILGLLTALPSAEHPVETDFRDHPEKAYISDTVIPFLQSYGAQAAEISPWCIRVEPAELHIPETPNLPAESRLACFLFTLPLLLGGTCDFEGTLCNDAETQDSIALLQDLGLRIRETRTPATIHIEQNGRQFSALPEAFTTGMKGEMLPLLTALAAAFALQGREISLPTDLPPAAREFLNFVGLDMNEDGHLSRNSQAPQKAPACWNAPSPEWALALASCACVRPKDGYKLGNAGIITQIWPRYWTLYNALPNSPRKETQDADTPKRRRILVQGSTRLPPLPDTE